MNRIIDKLMSQKFLFAVIFLAALLFHEFSSTNMQGFIAIVTAVFGVKAVQYLGDIVKSVKGG